MIDGLFYFPCTTRCKEPPFLCSIFPPTLCALCGLCFAAIGLPLSLQRLSWRGGTGGRLLAREVLEVATALSRYNDSILAVDLSGNQVGDTGARALAECLSRNPVYRSTPAVLQVTNNEMFYILFRFWFLTFYF